MPVSASPWPSEAQHPFTWAFHLVTGEREAPRPAGFRTAWRRLPIPLIECPLSGEWRLELAGGARFTVVPGQALVVASEVEHRLVAGSRPLTTCWAMVRYACGTDLELLTALQPSPRITAPDGGRLAAILGDGLHALPEARAGHLPALLAIERCGLDLLTNLAPYCAHTRLVMPAHGRRVATVLRYIETHLERPIVVDELAALIQVSPSRLHQITADVPGASIAGRCGFDDPGYFTRWFRRQSGSPPARWRAMLVRQDGAIP
jgi:AraC-like DNA-binding protein